MKYNNIDNLKMWYGTFNHNYSDCFSFSEQCHSISLLLLSCCFVHLKHL